MLPQIFHIFVDFRKRNVMARLFGFMGKGIYVRKVALAAFLFMSWAGFGNASYMFKHFGIKEGLSQSTVFAIIQDRLGFIWIGTKSGLNRFNGTAFVIYNSNHEKHSLGSDYITSLYESPDGDIWVGTDAGIWIYDPMTDSFRPFDVRSGSGAVITNTVNVITGSNGKVYMAVNEQGIFCYDLASRRLANYKLPGHPNVSGLMVEDNGLVWIGFFGGGLWKTDDSFRTISPFRTADGKCPFEKDIVTSILRLAPNRYMIGSEHWGLSSVDTKSKKMETIQSSYNGKNIFVRDIICKGNEIWAASEQGLFVYNLKTNAIQHYGFDPADPFSLSDNPLYSLFLDGDGGMWIGSYFGGVNYLPAHYPFFERFVPHGGTDNSFHGIRIREMVMDENGKIWIGTEDGGLNCMDPLSDKISFVKESLCFPNVHGLYADGGSLWIGTFSYGLRVMDINTQRILGSYTADGSPGSLKDNTIFSIDKSPDGVLYFGTIRGLCFLDNVTQKFVYVKDVPGVLINEIFFDTNGNLWVATQTDGVYLLKKNDGKWRNFRPGNGTGLLSGKVLSVFEDSGGKIWVTTQGGGVYRFNALSERMEFFNMDKFSLGNTIFRIEEDHQGIFWFTSYDGIIRYDPYRNDIRSYSNASILLDNQFNYNSSLIDKEGRIYFGSLNGLVRFKPEMFRQGDPPSRLVATDLMVGNGEVASSTSVVLKESIVFAKEISLSHDQNSFKIRVVPINYTNQHWSSVEYKLEGIDSDWQQMRPDYIIGYTNLPTGTYTLKVHVKDDDGQQVSREYTLKVEVRPYLLWSVWAKIAYVCCFCLISWWLWRFQNIRSRRKRQKAIKELEIRKEQELYQSKIRFFTDVAHEIRTPLTLIKSPLENIISSGKITSDEVKEDLDIMYQNTERLTDLINQLLDFRKAEQDGLMLNFKQCDISKIVTGVLNRFRLVLREKGISTDMSMLEDSVTACVDKECFTKIVSNLINNAVKYCVHEISIVLNADAETFTLIVRNDGETIPQGQRDKIFEPFFRMDTSINFSITGAGIGLALARSLAELHGGTLVMDDDTDMNVFRLKLPVRQKGIIQLERDSADEVVAESPKGEKQYTVLLVEDNVQMLEYEKRILHKEYNIIAATDGEEALKMLETNDVHLIVSDIMMEPMSGMAFCRKVKNDLDYSHIPVILLTAVTSDRAKIEGMENGADAYIVKPFSIGELLATIDSLIKERENIKKAYADAPFVNVKNVSLNSADAEFLRRLRDSVSRNMSNSEFNVDQLAFEMNMSRTSLNRKIRGVLDISPNNYIRIERLKEAARILKKDKYIRVSEVCYRVGFADPSYFSKCFYAQFGLLPKEFNNSENKSSNKNSYDEI